mgnify:CR=1 FL=1|tara:strand:+ start:79 stop:774 length:696 start_codon:yes stop_codon:yes gene_type:complete
MRKVAFCVPTTTNKRPWVNAEETDLWRVLLTELENHTPTDCDITLFIGYDWDCKVWEDAEQRMKCNATFTKFKIEWTAFGEEVKGKPTWIWNELAGFAISEGFEYLKILGDDIRLPRDTGWLSCFVNKLKKNQNIGWVAGYSNNDQIPTQFLIHKTHIDIFGFVYPKEIPNWGCDDALFQLYPNKWGIWLKSYPLLNVGGEPRYEIQWNENFVKSIVKRHKPKLNRFLSSK